MGTPEFALSSLAACFEIGEVVAVVTQPDKPKGRGQGESSPPAIKAEAVRRGTRVLQPQKIRDSAFLEALLKLAPDVCVVTAYGKILPKSILELPPQGCINVHASLLPRFRGAAPIQWAIVSGDTRTGVCLMKMDEGLDTGPVLACEEVPIRADETSTSLHARLAELGGNLLRRYLPKYLEGSLHPTPQPSEGVTYAPMLKKENGQLDFRKRAKELERQIRAFEPWPGSFTTLDGKLLKVRRAALGTGRGEPGQVVATAPAGLEVACGEGSLVFLEVHPEGKRVMTAAEFLAGRAIRVGDQPFPTK